MEGAGAMPTQIAALLNRTTKVAASCCARVHHHRGDQLIRRIHHLAYGVHAPYAQTRGREQNRGFPPRRTMEA